MIVMLGLMLSAPLFAQGRIMYSFDFNMKARNQSMWDPGLGRYDYTYFLGTNFSSSDSYNGYFNFFGETGVAGSASITGSAGLTFSAYADGGSVDIDYPVTIELQIPERDALVPGGPVVITSSLKRKGTATIITRTPDANVILRGTFAAQPSVTMTGKLSGETLFSGQVLSNSLRNINLSVDLFNLRNYVLPGSSDVSIDIFPTYPNLLRADLHYPIININATNKDPNGLALPLRGTGQDKVFTLTGNITAAVIYLIQSAVGSPPFNFLDQSVAFPPKSPVYTFSAGYSFLRAEARGTIGFKQDVEFLPRPKLRLERTDGTLLAEARVGEPLIFTMPASGSLEVRAKVLFENDFKNKFSLTLGGGLYFIPMEFYANGAIGPFSLGGFTLMPVDPYALEASHPFQLFERVFMMGGFNEPLTGNMPVQANTSNVPGVFYSVNFPGNTSARFGDVSATLKIEGRPLNYLNSQSVVYVNNMAIPTTFNAGQNLLTATLTRPQHDSILNTLRIDGFPVQVRTPGKPDSNILNFPVGYKRPLIDEIKAGGLRFETYTINSRGDNQDLQIEVSSQGLSFSRDLSVVHWNGQPLPTTYPNPFDGGYLYATIPAALLNTGVPPPQGGGQNVKITVETPLPGGGTSNEWGVWLLYPSPAFHGNVEQSLQPQAGFSVGDDGLAITVEGSNFLKGDTPETSSTVLFQPGATGPFYDLQTTFINRQKLMAVIPANLMQTAGMGRVDIRNPSPPGTNGQFTGNTREFRVLNPVSVVYRCDPGIVARGSGTMVVRVLGKRFKSFMQVYFNNSPRATTYISPTELRFTVTTAEMANGGINRVKVATPQPSPYPIAFSNEEWFTVRNPKPTLSSLQTSDYPIYSSYRQVWVYGSNFESSIRLYFNGQERTTTRVNDFTAYFYLTDQDVSQLGPFAVAAQNYPSEFSNALTLNIVERPTLYVSTTGNDANNGLSWAAAKRTIQNAINTAFNTQQVWVKAGTYNERITLKAGVPVYGGFAGNETSRTQRNLAANVSIIDGQQGGAVVTVPAGAGFDTVIDGFTIRNGLGFDGGGIACPSASPTISNNFIINNQANNRGGGIHAQGGNPLILNNVIARNSARVGGGIHIRNGTFQVVNNTIAYNSTFNPVVGSASGISVIECTATLANNIIAFGAGTPGIIGAFGVNATLRNNCVTGNPTNYAGISPGATDFADDPLFVNAATNDFHLRPTSPCFDRGSNTDAHIISVDFDGQDRFFGMAVDVGADEINPLSTPTIVVPARSVVVAASVQLEARLIELGAFPVAGQNIKFLINGNLIAEAVTDANGYARPFYTPPFTQPAGTFTLNAQFDGYRGLASGTGSGTLTIIKTPVLFTLPTAQGAVGESINLRARATTLIGIPIPNIVLTFKVDGNVVGNGVTGEDGWTSVAYVPPIGTPRGNRALRVEFSGNASVNSAAANGTLTIVNTPPVATLAGGAIQLSGGSDFVGVPGFANSAPTTEITIEFWQKVDERRQQAMIALEAPNNTNRIVAHTPWVDGVVYWDFGSIFTGGRLSYTPPAEIRGTWQHFAFVASQSGNMMRIYRNGVLEAQKSGMTPFNRGNYDLNIGSTYKGQFDEVRIWNYARSQTEIQGDLDHSLVGDEPGLIAYYRFDEATGTTVNNSAGASHTATLLNGAQRVPSGAGVNEIQALAGGVRSFTMKAFDVNNDPMSFATVVPPAHGILFGTPPNMHYLGLGINPTNMTYRANDGAANSNDALINLRFYQGPIASPAGSCFYFDGVDDYVQIGNRPALVMNNRFTIEAWIFPVGAGAGVSGSGGIIVNKEGEYEIARFSDGSIQYALANANPGWTWINTGFVAPLFQWTHLALVYDNGQIRLYANGTLVHTRNGFGSIGDVDPAQNDFRIGGRQNAPSNQYFHGLIDEVRVWNRVRTVSQIDRNRTAMLMGSEPGLVGYWRFDNGRGATASDSSLNGYNGSRLGAQWMASHAPIDKIYAKQGVSRAFILSAYDPSGDNLAYSVTQQPTRGNLSGSAPNLTYTATGTGIDSLKYVASEVGTPAGTVSKPATLFMHILLPGDVNGNGCVDDADLLLVLFGFGSNDPDLDLNGDGTVDDADLLEVLFGFGSGC